MNYAWLNNLYSVGPRGPGRVYETFVSSIFLVPILLNILVFFVPGRHIEFFKESACVRYFAQIVEV